MSIDNQLVSLLERLRDNNTGCAWNMAQTWSSLISYTKEEVIELEDAIKKGDINNICEELGDLLYHIAFYAKIAEEQGVFTLKDVADTACEKMVRRHKHIFPDGKIDGKRVELKNQPSLNEIAKRWLEVKNQEKGK